MELLNCAVIHLTSAKQVPMVFVLMSSRKTKDYKRILRAVLSCLDEPSVRQITVDFERALWSAVRDVLPNVNLTGFAFHPVQAVWRKVQELGLQTAYFQKGQIYKFLRRLMALPYLPSHEIAGEFFHLQNHPTAARVKEVVDYVEQNWIDSSIWPPRTNNDIEGWHRGLHSRACGKSQLPFYVLVELLQKEAKLVKLEVRLVNAQKLKRVQRRKYRANQARLFQMWDEYEHDQRTASQLLKACAHLNGPRVE